MNSHDVEHGNEDPLASRTRRAVLRLLAALPAAGGIAALISDDTDARKRSRLRGRRRKQRRDNARDRRRKRRKKRCKGKAKFCSTRCGPVKKKRCKKPLDCGPCRVFVTSTTQTGNLGGLSGADALCQNLAGNAGLPGAYRAWLSDNTQSPATRFSQSSGAYQLVNGVTIATSWADLTDGTLAAPITIAENGAVFDGLGLRSWTNTLANGTAGGALDENCNQWTTEANGANGDEGQVAATSDNWTDFASGTCNNDFHLYCFQQSTG